MNSKKTIRFQILSLFFISLGGWLLHLKRHAISDNPANYIPFIFGILNISIVPLLFNFKKTFFFSYLINGFGVIIGTILMAAMSLSGLPHPLTFGKIMLRTTLPDIFLLLPKLFIAQTIFHSYFPSGRGRLFTMAWWVKHFCYLAIIYFLSFYR